MSNFFPLAGQYPGTATNDSANAGNVGEYVSATVASGSPVSLTNNTAVNITSISLTAGDWDVTGIIHFSPAGTTTVAALQTSTSSTSANRDLGNDRLVGVDFNNLVLSNNATYDVAVPAARFSLASTTTIYLVAFASFSVSTCTGYGIISARRVR